MRFILKLVTICSLVSISYGRERQDLEIKIKDHFICEYGYSLSGSLYAKYCRKMKVEKRTLFILLDPSKNIIFDPELSRNSFIAHVSDWCHQRINDGNNKVKCLFQTKDKQTGEINVIRNLSISKNILSIRLDDIAKRKNFYGTLIEEFSGARANPVLFYNP